MPAVTGPGSKASPVRIPSPDGRTAKGRMAGECQTDSAFVPDEPEIQIELSRIGCILCMQRSRSFMRRSGHAKQSGRA